MIANGKDDADPRPQLLVNTMASYRVTKYDPSKRDDDGCYMADDWTSVSDVGQIVAGNVLSPEEYMEVEDGYVAAVKRFMAVAGVEELEVANLEIRRGLASEDDPNSSMKEWLREGVLLSGERVTAVVRACLREQMWCRLVGCNEVFVHFGHDYYMYLGLPNGLPVPRDVPTGIFVEEFESPYAQIDEGVE